MAEMIEGPIMEPSYFYPKNKIQNFMKSLPATDFVSNVLFDIEDNKIMIMTHDDFFDPQIQEIEKKHNIRSTWFLLMDQLDTILGCEDPQLHFNKESCALPFQIERFISIFRKAPKFNRIHRLIWRTDNFDLPYLALNEFKIDSTKIGVTPYRMCIEGKILPIWEVPFSVTDSPRERFIATYNIAKDIETMFIKEVSPITVLSHPFSLVNERGMKSCLYEAIECCINYGYKSMNMSDFYNKYLKSSSEGLE